MDDSPEGRALPPSLRFLKWLVIVLTVTMIAGVITVVAVIVTRMPVITPQRPVLPDTLVLPKGTKAAAVTAGIGWFAVVTTDNLLLIYDETGRMQQEVRIYPELGR